VIVIDRYAGGLHESGSRMWLGPPKTAASIRVITLPPFLIALLREHLDNADGVPVFTGPKGGWLRRSNVDRRILRPAADGTLQVPRAPVRLEPVRPGLTFHGLRHSHKTWLIADGVMLPLPFSSATVRRLPAVWGSGHPGAPMPDPGQQRPERGLRVPRVQVGVRGMPPCLEPVDQPLFHLRRDVGVRLDYPVIQLMAEPACLGDLRDSDEELRGGVDGGGHSSTIPPGQRLGAET
jgi:hypothetical protein